MVFKFENKMGKYNYIKAPVSVAKRAGLDGMRRSAGTGYVILSESDLRMLDLTVVEKIEFFGCEAVTEEQAAALVNDNSNADSSESDERNVTDNLNEDNHVGQEDVESSDSLDSTESMEGETDE